MDTLIPEVAPLSLPLEAGESPATASAAPGGIPGAAEPRLAGRGDRRHGFPSSVMNSHRISRRTLLKGRALWPFRGWRP